MLRAITCAILALLFTSAPELVQAKTQKHASTTKKKHRRHARARGQKQIDTARTRQIQQALIKARYLDGSPTGTLDTKTQEALRQFQKDNGWQTKVVPDSRALIKLGLGPSQDGLLNPESAMTTRPAESSTTPKDAPGTPQ